MTVGVSSRVEVGTAVRVDVEVGAGVTVRVVCSASAAGGVVVGAMVSVGRIVRVAVGAMVAGCTVVELVGALVDVESSGSMATRFRRGPQAARTPLVRPARAARKPRRVRGLDRADDFNCICRSLRIMSAPEKENPVLLDKTGFRPGVTRSDPFNLLFGRLFLARGFLGLAGGLEF